MTEPKSVVLPITPRGSGAKFSKFNETAEGRLVAKSRKIPFGFLSLFAVIYRLLPTQPAHSFRTDQSMPNACLQVRLPRAYLLQNLPPVF